MTEFWRRGLSSSQPPTYFITIRHKPRLLGASYWPSGGGSFKKPVRQFKEAFHFFSFFFFAILKRFLKRFLGFIGDSFWNSKWDSGNLFYLCITGCDFFSKFSPDACDWRFLSDESSGFFRDAAESHESCGERWRGGARAKLHPCYRLSLLKAPWRCMVRECGSAQALCSAL